MKYLLDTNTCIYLLKHSTFNTTLKEMYQRFEQCRVGDVGISSITWAEINCGLKQNIAQQDLFAFSSAIKIVPFDYMEARIYGELTQKFPNSKSFDRLIAAHAIVLKVTLVTNKIEDFQCYGLPLENWINTVPEVS
ncbi:MAG: type II toxin-antitoxin system VapC family toxin [Neisseriaceae bacterium]|nr:type II toxin-antitoxin system VapC family toxin [Neisseriaceae bacterium]